MTADDTLPSATTKVGKRPVLITMLLVVAFLIGAFRVVVIPRIIFGAASGSIASMPQIVLALTISLAILALSAATIALLIKRRRSGRLLGAGYLTLFVLFLGYAKLVPSAQSGSLDSLRVQYANPTFGNAVETLFYFLILFLILVRAWKVGWSQKYDGYFDAKPRVAPEVFD